MLEVQVLLFRNKVNGEKRKVVYQIPTLQEGLALLYKNSKQQGSISTHVGTVLSLLYFIEQVIVFSATAVVNFPYEQEHHKHDEKRKSRS